MMTKQNARDAPVSSDGECPQESADGRDAAEAGGHGAKTAPVRERALVALLSENTIGAAAQRCHVSERTLRRWMAEDEAFKQELATARRTMFEAAMNRLQPLAAQAVDTLAALMKPSAPPSVRLGAARTVAEFGIHRDDAETILRKLGDIEALQRRPGTRER
jgi:hypothetical protein